VSVENPPEVLQTVLQTKRSECNNQHSYRHSRRRKKVNEVRNIFRGIDTSKHDTRDSLCCAPNHFNNTIKMIWGTGSDTYWIRYDG
jgi:hypothetical protein